MEILPIMEFIWSLGPIFTENSSPKTIKKALLHEPNMYGQKSSLPANSFI